MCYYDGLVDSHAHLDALAGEGIDTKISLSEAARNGVVGILDVGVLPSDLDERRSQFGGYPIVRFASGLHPGNTADTDLEPELAILQRQLEQGGLVAVGEIGLDFHYTGDKRRQQAAFARQVAMASTHNLPAIVHNREAEDAITAVLAKHRPGGVMHCFSQSVEFCRRCLDLGMYISFAGNVTFPKAAGIRDAARYVPDDRLLVETDCPALSPVPVRGRPNHPGHLGFTVELIAEVRGVTPVRVVQLTSTNAAVCFGISAWRAALS
jgi:TatD DNase family protein